MDAQPLTRAELVEVVGSLKQELLGAIDAALAAQKQELHEALAAQKDEILEATQELVRDAQTGILKAFLPTQEGYNIRFRLFEANDAGLMDRMSILERRLQEIEKRLLMRPPAA